MPDDTYANIRDLLGSFIGCRVVDITQHDREDWEEDRRSYIDFHFDNGGHVRCFVGEDGFEYEIPGDPE